MAERRKKNKRKIIICFLVLIIIVLLIVFIPSLLKKEKNEITIQNEVKEENIIEEKIYELPDTTYTGMTVTDISVEYLQAQNKTNVSFLINNTSDRNIDKENITAYLLNESGEVLKSMNTFITKLDVGNQHMVNVIFDGDLSDTKQISLQKNDNSSNVAQNTGEQNIIKK